MNKEIRVVIKNPREKAQIVTLQNSLESLQSTVGGYIERVGGLFPHPIDLYCNDEGKLMGLEPNIVLPHGDFVAGSVVVTSSDRGGNTLGLPEDIAERVAHILNMFGLAFNKEETE